MRMGVEPEAAVAAVPSGTKLPSLLRVAKKLMPGWMLLNDPPLAIAAAHTA